MKPAIKPASEIDVLLRRVERTAMVVCLVMAVAAFAIIVHFVEIPELTHD